MEVWKKVKDYPELFEVSSRGRLRNSRTGRILKQYVHPHGYCHVATKIGGRKGINVCFKVHREVAKAFLPNKKNLPTVNHKDGDKTNNNVSNLEWMTYSDNTKHAYDTGLASPTCQKHRRKLSEEQVEYILNNYVPYSRETGSRALAKKFGVCKSIITKIVDNRGYSS